MHKKIYGLALALIMVCSLFVLAGCEKDQEEKSLVRLMAMPLPRNNSTSITGWYSTIMNRITAKLMRRKTKSW